MTPLRRRMLEDMQLRNCNGPRSLPSMFPRCFPAGFLISPSDFGGGPVKACALLG